MKIEVIVPVIGESVQYAQISNWLVEDGSYVEKDQEIVEIDSDKATLSVASEASGILKILKETGAKVAIGEVIAAIDSDGKAKVMKAESPTVSVEEEKSLEVTPVVSEKKSEKISAPDKVILSPVAKEMIEQNNLDLNEIIDFKLRITKNDVDAFRKNISAKPVKEVSRVEEREEMSPLRKKLSERLVMAKNQSAMLTTFNEVDLSAIIDIRKKLGEEFQKKHGVKLGYMSFFTKAVVEALRDFPAVNATIEGNEIVYHHFMDIGIAVSTPKGLMVPVIKNAETLSIAELEKAISNYAEKARNKKITLEDMSGGTFTITNGGVFGSLLSTPIINPPQVAILGMHKIIERPVGINGRIELRPMMNLALSYDHRIIDGKDSVSFLVKVIELLHDPVRLISYGNESIKMLLDL